MNVGVEVCTELETKTWTLFDLSNTKGDRTGHLYFCTVLCTVAQGKNKVRVLVIIKKSPEGARFSAPVQTGPEAHPASCTMGTGGLS